MATVTIMLSACPTLMRYVVAAETVGRDAARAYVVLGLRVVGDGGLVEMVDGRRRVVPSRRMAPLTGAPITL